MLAPKNLPPEYRRWNLYHGAPFGRFCSRPGTSRLLAKSFRKLAPLEASLLAFGPFSVQTNTTNRVFEYPWAFHVRPIRPAMKVLEIGGGLSGFQFALAKAGCAVTNVDPGMEAAGIGWPCDPRTIARMNKIFGTNVELINTTADRANLPSGVFDRAFSISVLEHLPVSDIEAVMQHVFRALKPGGEFILTVDLFLDIVPFAHRGANDFGRNIDLRWLTKLAPFELAFGKPAELYGFEYFDREAILSNIDNLLQGIYPVLVQCLILKKPL